MGSLADSRAFLFIVEFILLKQSAFRSD